ncbi:MAG TPA: MSMEG_4193 family putative phosphomutase [Anaerolineales bacterium]|nr:MSMEG_4193 family putative phosphomutase [Anaerolineales bacterium]
MTTFLLVRHGENDWVGRRLPGWTPGVHLNARGRAQAEALAGLLRPIRLAAVCSSPLERALETARPLARSKGVTIQRTRGLAEMQVGDWQGQSLRRLSRNKLWPIIQHTPSLARFPGGESFPEAQARIVAALEALRRKYASPRAVVACFSHGDMIKMAVAHYLGLPLDMFQRLAADPASITALHIGDGRAFLLRSNDTRATEAADRG